MKVAICFTVIFRAATNTAPCWLGIAISSSQTGGNKPTVSVWESCGAIAPTGSLALGFIYRPSQEQTMPRFKVCIALRGSAHRSAQATLYEPVCRMRHVGASGACYRMTSTGTVGRQPCRECSSATGVKIASHTLAASSIVSLRNSASATSSWTWMRWNRASISSRCCRGPSNLAMSCSR